MKMPRRTPKQSARKNDSSSERRTAEVTAVRPAGADHQVVTVVGGSGLYRRKPCATCPWRVDAVGEFPAQAFRVSAPVSYDMAERTFGCHSSGSRKPATCAGFLLRGATHNLAVRLAYMNGRIADDVHDGGHELHESYRAMAEANGVDPDDPALAQCR